MPLAGNKMFNGAILHIWNAKLSGMYIREIHWNQIFWGRNSLLNCRCLQRDWLVLRWRIASLLLHTTKLFNAKFPLLRFHHLKFRDGRYQNNLTTPPVLYISLPEWQVLMSHAYPNLTIPVLFLPEWQVLWGGTNQKLQSSSRRGASPVHLKLQIFDSVYIQNEKKTV